MSILDDRDMTPEEYEAFHEPERPGLWAGDDGADCRRLDQYETDALIAREISGGLSVGEYMEFATIAGEGRVVTLRVADRTRVAICQRGGIHSEPLVRVLAFRAWGNRDRRWFDDRGVRSGESVIAIDRETVVLAWPGERASVGIAASNAMPGEMIEVRTGTDRDGAFVAFRVGDRERTPPTLTELLRARRAKR